YIGMMVDSLNDSSDYLFLDSTIINFTLNCLSRVNWGEREQGRRIKRNDYDEARLKGHTSHGKTDYTKYSPYENIKCWAGAGKGIFRSDNVPEEVVVKIIYCFNGQYIGTNTREFKMKFLLLITDVYPFVVVTDFFGALRARIYDDQLRKWVLGTGIEAIEEKLWNYRKGPPTFDQKKLLLRSSLGMVTCLFKSNRML
ncbi:hypothetical protein H5410_015516, partial [Solanum commersonii]